jgi:hypothetical protein
MLSWRCCWAIATTAAAKAKWWCSGRRCLPQVRVSPQSGHEELVVLGGCTDGGLASMEPYTLDLTWFFWRRWRAEPAAGAAPGGGSGGGGGGPLPAPRQRSAAARVSRRWLLVLGGSSKEARAPGRTRSRARRARLLQVRAPRSAACGRTRAEAALKPPSAHAFSGTDTLTVLSRAAVILTPTVTH